jgi:hypothetical protein
VGANFEEGAEEVAKVENWQAEPPAPPRKISSLDLAGRRPPGGSFFNTEKPAE